MWEASNWVQEFSQMLHGTVTPKCIQR